VPARSTRPSPPARMVALLAERKRDLLVLGVPITEAHFVEAWDVSWAIMVTERAWPHATVERRAWRKAMREALYPEARACFLGQTTGFHRYLAALAEVMDQAILCEQIVVGQLVA
jgi:hypothetical protein